VQTIHERFEREKKERKKAIIIDLEGTLSDHSERANLCKEGTYGQYNALFSRDTVNEDFVSGLPLDQDIKIIMVTAKSEIYKDDVLEWLARNNIDWIDEIHYRCPEDDSPSITVKKLYLEALQERFDIVHAYDDREDICMMYRSQNIPCTLAGQKASKQTVSDILQNSAKIFEDRDAVYGSSYKQFGSIVDALFPDGIELNTVEDFNRWGVFHMMLSKVNRYANNFKKGGHKDSLADLITYAAMLQELDNGLQ